MDRRTSWVRFPRVHKWNAFVLVDDGRRSISWSKWRSTFCAIGVQCNGNDIWTCVPTSLSCTYLQYTNVYWPILVCLPFIESYDVCSLHCTSFKTSTQFTSKHTLTSLAKLNLQIDLCTESLYSQTLQGWNMSSSEWGVRKGNYRGH